MSDIHAAVATSNLETVKAALQGDCSQLNTANADKQLPLITAIKGKNHKIAEMLIAHGANVNQESPEAGTQSGYTAAHFCAKNGDIDGLKLLKKEGADLDRVGGDGWCPIHAAAFSNKPAAIHFLVENGANIDALNSHKLSAIVFVANHGRASEVRYLLEKNASSAVHDISGDSLLHHALHFQMSKLFDGEYDVPECQYDVAVVLAISGVSVDAKNNDGLTACEFFNDDVPSLQRLLLVLAANAVQFKASKTEWNYMSLLAAQVQHYAGMGIEMRHAVDIFELIHEVEKERVADKKRREEERPAGGCPVMKGGRRKKGQKAVADQSHPEMPADGSDPSNGACPFIQKKKAEDGGATDPKDHPQAPADGSDPSNGACPHFQKKETTPAAATMAPPPPLQQMAFAPPPPPSEAPALGTNNQVIKLDFNFVYQNSTVLLCMLVAFFFGMIFEQKLGRK